MKYFTTFATFVSLLLVHCGNSDAAIVVDFEDLSQFTGNSPAGGGQFYNGNNGTGSNNSGWTSNSVYFANNYTDFGTFDIWEGWAYSNVVNSTSPGFLNQYAAYPGSGANGSNNYAVAFTGSAVTSTGAPLTGSVINLPQLSRVDSVDLSNATYTALFAQGFDGFNPEPDANHLFSDGDFFRVTVSGFSGVDGTGSLTGSLDFDLIDYGNPGAVDDFLQSTWETFDLSGLGGVRSLVFATSSSKFSSFDGGTTFFADTPSYVALDNLTLTAVPEPSTLLPVGAVALCLAVRRRRARKIR